METQAQPVPVKDRIRTWKAIADALGVSVVTAMGYARAKRLKVRKDHIGIYTSRTWLDAFITQNDQSYDEVVAGRLAS